MTIPEAFEIAAAYLLEHNLPFQLKADTHELLEVEGDLQEIFHAFPTEVMPSYKVLVSEKGNRVEGVWRKTEVLRPHQMTAILAKEEAHDIVSAYLGERLGKVEIGAAYLYITGIFEHPKPCWIVYTKNLGAHMEGTHSTDYVVDLKTKQVVTSLTT